MLRRSFCCFNGLSADAERALWRAGILEWHHLAAVRSPLSSSRTERMRRQLPELEAALEGGAVDYFLKRLPPGYRLRVWPDAAEDTAFLDIETTGLEATSEITVIGVLYRGCVQQFVKGSDLHKFLSWWGRIKLLITFNGTRFDVPAICRHFRLTQLPAQIDLMQEARALGYAGGLKSIEQKLHLRRLLADVDGEAAVQWWQDFEENGNRDSLHLLLKYNRDDVVNLSKIARRILRKSFDGCPIPPPYPSALWQANTVC